MLDGTAISGVLGGIRGYTAYTNLRGFLTAYTHLSDHKEAGYIQALRHAPLRIPTSIFSNTPLTAMMSNTDCTETVLRWSEGNTGCWMVPR